MSDGRKRSDAAKKAAKTRTAQKHGREQWEQYLNAPGDLIDNLPTSSRAADVKTALAMVDREREMREELRAEVDRLRAERDAARNGRQGADAAVRVLEAAAERLREDMAEGRRLVDRMFRLDRPSVEWEQALANLRAWQWDERP